MKKKLQISIILLSLISTAFAQEVIKGVVKDESGTTLPGATVVVKGTNLYALSDVSGAFSLQAVKALPVTLLISSVGFKTQDVEVYELNDEPLEVLLKNDNVLDEIVVVGYGEQKKSDLVGAVTKVDPSKLKTIPESSFETQLQGGVAGVQINGGTGIPGSNTFIRVRGATSINSSNDPLYIVDGVFVNNTSLQSVGADRTTSPLSDINPNDIQSIEVLKDAAAVSIYGSRGANGVVIVTTKRGDFEQAPKVEFDLSNGIAWVPKSQWWDLASGPEHATLVEEYRANEGLPSVYTSSGRGLPEEQETYDRQSILNREARIQNYNIAVSGGSKSTSYYIGVGHSDQEGIWKPMGFKRSSLKVNLDQKLSDKIKIGTSNTLSRSNRIIGRAVGSGGTGALYQSSIDIPTLLPIFDEDGKPLRWSNFDNIQQLIDNYDASAVSNHYVGILYGELTISPTLSLRSSVSLDYNLYEEKEYWNTNILRGLANNGEGISSYTQSNFSVSEQLLTYKNTFGDHSVGVLLGNHVQSSLIKNTYARGTNFPNNQFTLISAASNQTVTETWGKNNLVSFFSRLNYNYKEKYFVEGSVRADGSSKFSSKNRWGYFPAAGIGWVISNEDFLADQTTLSHLKLRASYGIAGNQNGINDFAYRGLWRAGAGYPDAGTSELPGTAPLQLSNPDLSWEKTTQFNVGLDLEFFRNRLGLEINYYDKYTTDALLEIPVPGYTGFNTYLTNFGEISNKGFEFTVNSVNIERNDFSWKTSFNIAKNINRIEVLPNPITYERFSRIEEGVALYSYWLYNVLAVDSETGDLIIEDVTGDGTITTDDRKVVGDAWPDFFGGLTNSFTYKNFDVNLLFTFSYGNYLWNHNRALSEHGGRLDQSRALSASQLNRWQQPGDVTDVPRLTLDNYSRQELSRFFEDASFLRLRSLTFGYTLPSQLSSKYGVEKLRVYFSGTNLFLATKYTGADPETRIERGQNQNIQGYDFASPPTPRTVQFGINLTL
jgi:TonB-linked SusC/RagA family outer membrane protein